MKTKNKIIIGSAVVAIAYFLWDRSKKKKKIASVSNESNNLDLPTGMDLPNLTPSTKTPTGMDLPNLTPSTKTPTETALNNSLIAPIDKSAQLAEQEPVYYQGGYSGGGGGGGGASIAHYLEDRFQFDRIEQQMY